MNRVYVTCTHTQRDNVVLLGSTPEIGHKVFCRSVCLVTGVCCIQPWMAFFFVVVVAPHPLLQEN